MSIYPRIDYDALTNAELDWVQDGAAGNIKLTEVSAPSGTASGVGLIYVKSSDSKLYYQDDSGTETDLTASGGTPGGANTQVQFNDSSAFGGDGGFTFNKATGVVTATAFVTNTGTAYSQGGTDVLVADGGTGASNAAGARTNLGLVIGTNVQAWDDDLDDLAALTHSASAIIVSDGTNWVRKVPADARGDLGLVIGTDVQAFDAQLSDIAGLTPTASAYIAGNGANFISRTNVEVRNDIGLAIPLPLSVGGVGTASLNSRQVILSGTTDTGNLRTIGIGNVGQVLTSNGSGVDPAWKNNATASVQMLIVDSNTDVSVGNGRFYFHADSKLAGLHLVEAHARHIDNGPVGTSSLIRVTNTGQSGTAATGTAMFSTPLYIEPNESRSDQAATAYVISATGSAVLLYDLFRVDVDSGGSTGSAKGLIVTLGFNY